MKRQRTKGNEKRKHHFVPIAYLKGFTSTDGKLHVYLKDEPEKLICQTPENVGFRKYYYSQPKLDGGWDNNILDDHFAEYEAKWPGFVKTLRDSGDVSEELDYFFQFLMLQMSRTPATREMVELVLSEQIKLTAKLMDKLGMLPSKPGGLEDILKKVIVTIDPHMSIGTILNFVP
ncbi:DUF4238 domain-containing protein [Actibacterium sp. D379-3]